MSDPVNHPAAGHTGFHEFGPAETFIPCMGMVGLWPCMGMVGHDGPHWSPYSYTIVHEGNRQQGVTMTTPIPTVERFLAAWNGDGIGIKTESGEVVSLPREVLVSAVDELRTLRADLGAYQASGASEALDRVLELATELEAAGEQKVESGQVAERIFTLLQPPPEHDPAVLAAVTDFLVREGLNANDRMAQRLLDAIEAALPDEEPVEVAEG